jgi:hypothetical protein
VLLLRHLSSKTLTEFPCKQGDLVLIARDVPASRSRPTLVLHAATMPEAARYLRLTVRDNIFIEACMEQLED